MNLAAASSGFLLLIIRSYIPRILSLFLMARASLGSDKNQHGLAPLFQISVHGGCDIAPAIGPICYRPTI